MVIKGLILKKFSSDGTTTGYMKIKVDDIINKVLSYLKRKETIIEM